MTSKCGRNKKVAQEAIAECVADVLATIFVLFHDLSALLSCRPLVTSANTKKAVLCNLMVNLK